MADKRSRQTRQDHVACEALFESAATKPPASPYITIVIATFNRSHCIVSSIRSAHDEFDCGVVIVVDDASTDDTVMIINREFTREIKHGSVRLLCLGKNVGVTGAKNAGYAAARTAWVLFLDSDDIFSPGVGPSVVCELSNMTMSPIVFFRCRDQNNNFVGIDQGQTRVLDLKCYLAFGSYGEALTAVNKNILGGVLPYAQELRGYEGLGCSRMIKQFGPAFLSSIVARVYFRGRADALSSFLGILNRAKYLAIGHKMIAREFYSQMTWTRYVSYRIKALIYLAVHLLMLVKR